MAYERAAGPIGSHYNDEMLAECREQLSLIAWILSEAYIGKGEMPTPKPVERPVDLFKPEGWTDDEEEDEGTGEGDEDDPKSAEVRRIKQQYKGEAVYVGWEALAAVTPEKR